MFAPVRHGEVLHLRLTHPVSILTGPRPAGSILTGHEGPVQPMRVPSFSWISRGFKRTRLEHLFGEAKEHHGLGRAHGRGLVRVDQQVKFTATAQNLKRLLGARNGDRHRGSDGGPGAARRERRTSAWAGEELDLARREVNPAVRGRRRGVPAPFWAPALCGTYQNACAERNRIGAELSTRSRRNLACRRRSCSRAASSLILRPLLWRIFSGHCTERGVSRRESSSRLRSNCISR